MADFIVLEEDGTSHLELEESSSDLLLEDGSLVHSAKGFGKVGTRGSGVTPRPRPSRATWEVGTFTTPSGTGSMAVTGLRKQPLALIFYGTNWTTYGSVVTSGANGMFRGMAAPRYTDRALIQQAVTNTPVGEQTGIDNYGIYMHTTAGTGTTLYRASVTSFDSHGFTVNFDTAASGYTIVYIALYDVVEVASFIGSYNTTVSIGFKAGASLLHGHRGSAPFTGGTNTQGFYGGAQYRTTTHGNWLSASATNATFPDASGQRYNSLDVNDPTILTASGVDNFFFTLTQTIHLVHPSGTGLTNLTFTTGAGAGGGAGNWGMVVAWDDEDSATGITAPASSATGTTTISGLPFAPALVIGYTISNVSPGGGIPTGTGALGFWVATADFQWCCVSDDGSAFQALDRGFADTVGGSNVHAGTVELTDDGFILTTVEDTEATHNIVWHAFGHPISIGWIPQSYRRRNKP